IPPERQDRQLPDKLLSELSGILTWAVKGCRDWLEYGLEPPPVVIAATSEYRKDEDVLTSFLTEHCEIRPDLTVKTAALYGRYKEWAEANNETSLKQRSFGAALTETDRGFTRYPNNGVWYRGLALRDPAL